MLIKLNMGTPEIYSLESLRADNPNVSFPADPSESLLAEWDVHYCYPVNPTGKDELSHKIVNDEFSLINGKWFLNRKYEQLPLDEASDNVRKKRNALLLESDWTQVIDAKVDQASWAEYRQQLRDISDQPTFPYLVNWPTKPE